MHRQCSWLRYTWWWLRVSGESLKDWCSVAIPAWRDIRSDEVIYGLSARGGVVFALKMAISTFRSPQAGTLQSLTYKIESPDTVDNRWTEAWIWNTVVQSKYECQDKNHNQLAHLPLANHWGACISEVENIPAAEHSASGCVNKNIWRLV